MTSRNPSPRNIDFTSVTEVAPQTPLASLFPLIIALSLGHVAQAETPAIAPWAYDIADRPAVIVHTDYYVYGPEPAPDNRFIYAAIDPRSYDEPVTVFLSWMDRESGQHYFLNEQDGLQDEPADLYGSADSLDPVTLDGPSKGLMLAAVGLGNGPFPEMIAGGLGDLPQRPGLYGWKLELRDATGQHTLTHAHALYSFVNERVTISGTLEDSQTWTADKAYFLDGYVTVPDGVTLTIEPGTFVFGKTNELSLLNVRPGGRLVANGEPTKPIVFTSELPVLQRGRSDWGGVVINGDAPINEPGAIGEGNTGTYGGDNPLHDGGVLRYVRVEFSGRIFTATDELNGLTLQGCGSRTIIDHVQVHQSSDDGIEFFGGTVNARYLLITGCGDDSLDWTFGYTGKLQHIVLMQLYGEAHRGIEADNNTTRFDAQPVSHPTIYNATFLGLAQTNRRDAQEAEAIMLRRGSGINLHNAIFTGFGGDSIDVEGQQSADLLEEGKSRISHCLFYRNNLLTDTAQQQAQIVQEILDPRNHNNLGPEPGLTSFSVIRPDLTPMPGSFAATVEAVAEPPKDGFFQPVNYLGGVAPNGGPEGPWIFGPWTNYIIN